MTFPATVCTIRASLEGGSILNRLNDAIDQFCAKHRNFGISNLMRYIVIGTALVAILDLFTRGSASSFLTFDLSSVLKGEVFRIIGFLFVPETSNPFFLLISLYFYYMIGNTLEREWGTGRFTIYVASGVLLTLLFTIVYSLLSGISYPLAGISYISQSLFFAFAMLYPDAQVLLIFIPIKIKWIAGLEAILFVFSFLIELFSGAYYYALLPVVALLNFFIYFAPYFKRQADRIHYQSSRQATQFRQAARQQQTQQHQQQAQGYRHKCCVCGKTDAEYPNLAFRYCSKCVGYHCFCEEHIFNHVHFTEE